MCAGVTFVILRQEIPFVFKYDYLLSKFVFGTNKYHTSVNNTTFILYTMVYIYILGQHVSTQQVILRPSKNTDLSVFLFFCSTIRCVLGRTEDNLLSRNMSH